jgi:hypothetical protein
MRAKKYLKASKRRHCGGYGGGSLLTFPFDVSLTIEVSAWVRLVAEMNMLTYYDTFFWLVFEATNEWHRVEYQAARQNSPLTRQTNRSKWIMLNGYFVNMALHQIASTLSRKRS